MIHVAICDDDKALTKSLAQLLRTTASEQGVDITCELFFEGSELIRFVIEQHMYFDLIYLDIEMNDIDGIHAAQALRDAESPALIVYISAHEEYWKELFRTNPFRFLSKPIEEKAFCTIFNEACTEIGKRNYYFSFRYKKTHYQIPLNKITYFESSNRLILIHLSGKNEESPGTLQSQFYGKINEVEKQITSMNGRFLRIHQSFLVNFDYILSIGSSRVKMLDGTVFKISEERKKKAIAQFCALSEAAARREGR